jgi:hypothetical protein
LIEKHIVRISFDVVYAGRDDSSAIRFAYTVTGDAVDLVTRPGGITKEYGADIIVGAGTRNAVPEVVFSELDRVRVKGKSWDGTFTFKAKSGFRTVDRQQVYVGYVTISIGMSAR